jgi:hypothetical protein
VHDLVLVGADAERGVLVRDPREQLLRQVLRGRDQRARERRDRPRQRLLLLPAGLVAPVEGPVEQLRMRAEQVRVEPPGDLPDVLTDRRQGGLDDGAVLLREHG